MNQKNQEADIRKNWFGQHTVALYQSHVDKRYDGQEHLLETLWWRRPHSGIFGVRYIAECGTLYVSGDIGEAVYRWSGEATLAWIADCELSYFASKCTASEHGRGYESWDTDKAKASLYDIMEDDEKWNSGGKKDFEDWHQGCLCSEHEWHVWLAENCREVLHDDPCDLSEIGKVVDARCHGHLIGLKMAMGMIAERASATYCQAKP